MSSAPKHPKQIFLEAIEHYAPDQWPRFLDQACGDDRELKRRVEVLLEAHVADQSLLDKPAIECARKDFAPTITEPPTAEQPGAVIGPYRLLEQIGEGGFGIVYLAEQTDPVRRKVALKVLKPGMDTRQVVARFEAERQALALMDHPNIAKVFDGGATDAGRPYFVMELVHGSPITEHCDRNNLPVPGRLELFVTVCRAVQHAHQKGIIHRDIKPSNVLVKVQDDKPVVKIIDFGVAKAMSGQLTDKTLCTGIALMIGTPLYMSPEAAFSGLDVDTRSDIYSLGVLLYELLTGTTPFEKQRLKEAAYGEIQRIIREEDPPRPSTRLSDLGKNGRHSPRAHTVPESSYLPHSGKDIGSVPATSSLASISAVRKTEPHRLSQLLRGELDWIVMRCLEKDRTRRYATALGLASDVEHYLADEPVEACPPSAAYRFRKFIRRNRAALATIATVATALLIAVVGLVVSNILVTAERDQKIQALNQKETALQEKERALTEAKRQKGLEQETAKREQEQKIIAESQRRLAQRRYYAAQMNLAMQAWRAGEAPRVLELLEGQRPGPDEEDLRGFEWYYLWRLCNGGRRLYLHGHTNAVLSVAFSPDGKTLASASWDGTVRLWDTTTGREIAALRGHDTGGPWDVVFSPDGKTLASSGLETSLLILWDVATGRMRHAIPGPVSGLAFSPDSSSIAGGLVKESGIHARLWDVASGEERLALTDTGRVVGFHPDGNRLVTAWLKYSASSEVRVWDLKSGSHGAVQTDYRAAVLSPDGSRIATAGYLGIDLWETDTGLGLPPIPVPAAWTALAFSPDGKRLAGAVVERTVTVWDIESRHALVQDVHLDPARGVAFSPDGRTLATSTVAGAIKLWDMTPADEATTIPNIGSTTSITGSVTSMRFDPSGRTLLVGSTEPTKIIDVGEGKVVAVLPTSFVISISEDAASLALMAGANCVIRNTQSWREMARLPVTNSTKGTLSRDGTLLATFEAGHANPKVTLWDIATQQARTLEGDPPPSNRLSVHCAEFSPDGRLLAAGFQFQWIVVWDVATGQVKLQFSQSPGMMNVVSLAFTPDSKALAVGTDVGTVTLWDVDSKKRLESFRGHTSAVYTLAFSPDGRTLVSGSRDKTVRLWDVLTGQERCTLTGHQTAVFKVQFSPDGNTLASVGSDAIVRLWRAATDPDALARRPNLPSDDPRYVVASSYHKSAWLLATGSRGDQLDPDRAVELAQKAVELLPNEARFWVTLGIAHYRAAHWQAALDAFGKSQELAPEEEYIYRDSFRALAFWQLGEKDRARNSYFRAADRFAQNVPHDPWHSRWQREAAELLGLPVSAGPLSLPPGALPSAVLQLLEAARPFAGRREWKQAAAELAAGFKLPPPDNSFAWFSLALARVLAGDLPGYMELAQQIPERFRGREDMHVIGACLLRAEGATEPTEVLRWARREYDTEKNAVTAYNLGVAHYRAGDFERARQHIDEARTIADRFQFWPALAMTHHRLRQGGAAREWLDKSEAAFCEHKGNGERVKYIDEHPYWQNWAYFEALLLEAREVIESEMKE